MTTKTKKRSKRIKRSKTEMKNHTSKITRFSINEKQISEDMTSLIIDDLYKQFPNHKFPNIDSGSLILSQINQQYYVSIFQLNETDYLNTIFDFELDSFENLIVYFSQSISSKNQYDKSTIEVTEDLMRLCSDVKLLTSNIINERLENLLEKIS